MMNIEYFFPTPIYIFDIPNASILNADLEKNVINWSNSEKGLNKTNVNGWHLSLIHISEPTRPY